MPPSVDRKRHAFFDPIPRDKLGDAVDPAPNFIMDFTFDDGRPLVRNPVDLRPHVDSFSIEEDLKMATKTEIMFDNHDFLIHEHPLLQAGQRILMQTGWGNSIFDGHRKCEIVRGLADFAEDGKPKFKVTAYDGRHPMLSKSNTAKRTQGQGISRLSKPPTVFKRQTDSQIISRIAGAFGMAIDIDPTTTRRSRIKKKSQTYWAFLLDVAKKNRFDIWVDWDNQFNTYVLHFRRRELEKLTEGYVLTYGNELLSFTPRFEIVEQDTKIEIISFDCRTRKIAVHPIDGLRQRRGDPETGAVVKFRVAGQTIAAVGPRPFKNQKQAKEFAKNYLLERKDDFIVCEGKTIGIENLRPRQAHRLIIPPTQGTEKQFSGTYFFTHTRQNYVPSSPGFTTNFVAFKILSDRVSDFTYTMAARG